MRKELVRFKEAALATTTLGFLAMSLLGLADTFAPITPIERPFPKVATPPATEITLNPSVSHGGDIFATGTPQPQSVPTAPNSQ